jgi:hypothetical protein
MSFISRPAVALTAAMLGIAALLGGSLGIVVAAHNVDLVGPGQGQSSGFNLVGGPLIADTPPQDFLACLPEDSWVALYIWDAQNQKWQHYFNPDSTPDYINSPQAGGIATIKRLAGVVILTSQAVPDARLKDRPQDTC